ncbi:MAG: hypothetical protein H6995_15555 [Pseudomonadales bacterium]|nr:hypothetical protein [Pseudomonadales bacterium]MCP5216418.1 hypothetical protein [Pseudomonadales bacterium]
MLLNITAIVVTILVFLFLANKKLLHSVQWKATVTPLASIIGSGFLIIAPLLHSVLGKLALGGIMALSILAYAIGSVIRFNIRYAEPYLASHPRSTLVRIEKTSQGVLGIAYAISVAFYISLFVAFVFDRLSVASILGTKWATTALLLTIMALAWWRGTRGLEWVELFAVTIKLSIIVGVLVALASYDIMSGTVWFEHEPIKKLSNWDTIAMLAGMLMVTQGFETTRFMGAQYPQQVRINAARYSQGIAIFLYVVFIGLTCPIFLTFPIAELNETSISYTLGNAISVIPILLLFAATASQLSAALADTLGGGGLLKDLVPTKFSDHIYYVLVVALSIGLIWSANVFEIINYASKGFAIYYLFQVLIALVLIKKQLIGANKRLRLGGGALLALLLVFVILWSIPAPNG